MKITEDVRKYAAEQGITEEAAIEKGLKEKAKEFVKKARKFTPKYGIPPCVYSAPFMLSILSCSLRESVNE